MRAIWFIVGALVVIAATSITLSDRVNQALGYPGRFGADSWIEVLYWIGGAVLAIIALIALRQRVTQARATFVLLLYERWDALKSEREQMGTTFRARRIRQGRLEIGQSQNELAAALGVSYQQVQKYENRSNRLLQICPPLNRWVGTTGR